MSATIPTSAVAEHYNAVPEKGRDERTASRIFYQRNLNNWMKSMLIAEFAEKATRRGDDRQQSLSVLDLCCGKGGDLLKWKIAGVTQLVGADIAEISLEQCRSRYEEMREANRYANRNVRPLFSAEFIHADCTTELLREKFATKDQSFDLCSCQFSLHYGFASLGKAETILRNACESLKPGGYFIGTIPDANYLMYACGKDLKLSNEVMSIELKPGDNESPKFPLFGAEYHFSLHEVVNLPEYLVHFPLLERMLARLGMELVYKKSFPELFAEKSPVNQHKGLLERMQALEPYPPHEGAELSGENVEKEYGHAKSRYEEVKQEPSFRPHVPTMGTVSDSEWEVICVYLAFAFRKKVDVNS